MYVFDIYIEQKKESGREKRRFIYMYMYIIYIYA